MIDPEWFYGACGQAAGCEVRLREQAAIVDDLVIQLSTARAEHAKRASDAKRANALVLKLIQEMADDKQGIADDPERESAAAPRPDPSGLASLRLDRAFP